MDHRAGLIFLIITSFILPFFLMAAAAIKLRSLKPVKCGVLYFLIFQICIRLPIIQYVLPRSAGFIMFQQTHTSLYLFLLSLSAGVFEEGEDI